MPLDQLPQGLFGVAGVEQRPVGPLAHPPRQNIRIGLQPDGDAALGDPLAGDGIDIGAAAGRQHQPFLRGQVANHIGFALTKTGFAFDFENQRNSRASARFDFMVGIDKALVQLLGQCAPYRGFA